MKFWRLGIIVFSFLFVSFSVFAEDASATKDTKFYFYTNSGLKNNLSFGTVEKGQNYYFSGKFVNNSNESLDLYIGFVDGIVDSEGHYLGCKNEGDGANFGNYVQIVSANNLSGNKISLAGKSSVDVQFLLNLSSAYSNYGNHVGCITHYVLLSGEDNGVFSTLSRKGNFVDLSVVNNEPTQEEPPYQGGHGHTLKKDYCPNGDFSDSYYDKKCGDVSSVHNAPGYDKSYSDEMNEAYQYCYSKGVTTMYPIGAADMGGYLTRIAMAKMLSKYAINVLGLKPDATRQNKFADVTDELDAAYNDGVTLAYQLGIMGINMPNNEFRPHDLVPRREFVTAFSRMKYKTTDGEYVKTAKYYTNHMNNLVEKGIITNPNPSMLELRGYVMLILMRSAKTD